MILFLKKQNKTLVYLIRLNKPRIIALANGIFYAFCVLICDGRVLFLERKSNQGRNQAAQVSGFLRTRKRRGARSVYP
jgi:hypothetical protein